VPDGVVDEVVIGTGRSAGYPRVRVDPQFLADFGLPFASASALTTTSPLRTTSNERSGKMLRTAAWTLTVPGPESSTVPHNRQKTPDGSSCEGSPAVRPGGAPSATASPRSAAALAAALAAAPVADPDIAGYTGQHVASRAEIAVSRERGSS
jgi:hypothetical protein